MSWSESYNSSTDRIWQELIISSVFPLSVNLEACPTRLCLSSCWVLIWQLWFGCCAISMLVTFCSVTFFKQIQMVSFPFFPWTWARQMSGWESAGRQPGKMRCQVQGVRRWARQATQAAVANCDCSVTAQLWPPLPISLPIFLVFTGICWLLDFQLMNIPSSIFLHNISSNRRDLDFSWSHFQVRVLQGAALAAASDKPGTASSRRESRGCLAMTRASATSHLFLAASGICST